MIKLKINDQLIEVKKGATLLEAAKKAGIKIPTMCFKEGYTAAARLASLSSFQSVVSRGLAKI